MDHLAGPVKDRFRPFPEVADFARPIMTAPELLDLAWNYPLFEALYGRRSRRFGLGFEMPEGPFRYKSAHAPVPLSEIEEALLVGAGAGFSRTGVLGFADAAALPWPQRPHIPDNTAWRPHGAVLHQRRRVLVLDANFAASKLREIGTPDERTSSSKRTARSVGSCAVAGSTSRAAYCR